MCEFDIKTKTRKALYITSKVFYILCLVLLCIVFSDLRHRPKTFDSSTSRSLSNIFSNTKELPIYSITATTDTTCTTGTNVKLGTWAGTSAGCQCSSTVYTGPCTASQSSCTNIAAISSQAITNWNGVKFCIQRVSEYTLPTGAASCASGYQYCAGGICVPTADTCPITDLRVVSSTATVGSDYTAVALGTSAYQLIYSNTIVDEPITDLTVSLFDLPCMDPNAIPVSSSKSIYPLYNGGSGGCGSTGTIDHLEISDKKSMGDVFTDNSISTIIATLPDYSSYYSSEYAYLSAERLYVLYSTSGVCGQASAAIFVDLSKWENQYVGSIYGVLIAGLVVMSVLFFTILIEIIFRVRKNEEETQWLQFFANINLLILFSACMLFVVAGSFGIRARIHLRSETNILGSLSKANCFRQEVVNQLLLKYQNDVGNFYAVIWLSISLFIVAACGLVTIVIMIVADTLVERKNGKGNRGFIKGIGLKNSYTSTGRRRQPANTNANIEMLLK